MSFVCSFVRVSSQLNFRKQVARVAEVWEVRDEFSRKLSQETSGKSICMIWGWPRIVFYRSSKLIILLVRSDGTPRNSKRHLPWTNLPPMEHSFSNNQSLLTPPYLVLTISTIFCLANKLCGDPQHILYGTLAMHTMIILEATWGWTKARPLSWA